nr:hypothetical protein [Anaerolineae bacterium]
MKRQLIVVGLAAFALLLFASITATLAAPGSIPFLQSTSETEPNNSFDEADEVDMPDPGYIIGVVSNTPVTETLDYFKMSTGVGHKYQANLTIDSPQGLNLKMVLWNGDRQYMDTSSSSSSSTSISWTANTTFHYIRVEAVTISTSTLKTAEYRLDVFEKAEPTDTPTPTYTPSPDPWDEYEPNDSFTEVYTLPIMTSATLENLNFHPYSGRAGPDEDWFALYVKDGRWYQATTSDLNNVDTYMEIRNQDNNVVESSEDEGGGFASQAKWEASYDGYYYIRIINRINTSGSDDTYDLTVEEISAPATATPGPSPTPGPGPDPEADSCEDNLDFVHACIIPVNQSQTFNFVPPYGGVDNDFYRIWVKPGLMFECATSDLSPGVDPNMIVFTGPSWDNAIGGNDDVQPGNYNSYFAYYATYEGWLYLLVGTGDRTPSNVYDSDYTLRCDMRVPGQPTATNTPEPTSTPQPTTTPTTPGSPVATPTPSGGLTVRTLATP